MKAIVLLSLATAAGILLTAVPAIFGAENGAADVLHVLGPLVASFACMAIAVSLRVLRWVVSVLGVAAMASTFLFDMDAPTAIATIAAGSFCAVAGARAGADPFFRGRWKALLKGG